MSVLSQIGPTNSILPLAFLFDFKTGIISCFTSYKAGLTKSFIPASKMINFVFPLFLIKIIFEINAPALPTINLPGSKITLQFSFF